MHCSRQGTFKSKISNLIFKIWVAKKSGSVNALSLENGSLLMEKSIFSPLRIGEDVVLNKHKRPEHFIGLYFDNSYSRYFSSY